LHVKNNIGGKEARRGSEASWKNDSHKNKTKKKEKNTQTVGPKERTHTSKSGRNYTARLISLQFPPSHSLYNSLTLAPFILCSSLSAGALLCISNQAEKPGESSQPHTLITRPFQKSLVV
jgi:hypothetical protein